MLTTATNRTAPRPSVIPAKAGIQLPHHSTHPLAADPHQQDGRPR